MTALREHGRRVRLKARRAAGGGPHPLGDTGRAGAPFSACAGEVFGQLVLPAVFKTDETEYLGLAGSIPVRLRQQEKCALSATL